MSTNPTNNADAEIAAMAAMAEALEQFEPRVRHRMLEWLIAWSDSQVDRWNEWLREAEEARIDDQFRAAGLDPEEMRAIERGEHRAS